MAALAACVAAGPPPDDVGGGPASAASAPPPAEAEPAPSSPDDLAWVIASFGAGAPRPTPEVLAEAKALLDRSTGAGGECVGCLPKAVWDDLAAVLATGAFLADDAQTLGTLLSFWIPACQSACASLASTGALAHEAGLVAEEAIVALTDEALPHLSRRDAVEVLVMRAVSVRRDGTATLGWRREFVESLPYDPGVRGRMEAVLGVYLDAVRADGVTRREAESLFSLLRVWRRHGLARELAALSPHADLAHWMRAWAHTGGRDWAKAALSLSAWERGGVAEHHRVAFHSLGAKVAARQGRRADAIGHLEEMARRGGGEDGLYRLAGYLMSLGRFAEADDAYGRYLERYPEGDRADLVRYHLFRLAAEDEPLTALAWLAATTDPDLEPIRLYWRWRLLDDAGAKDALLAAHPLSYWALYVARREGWSRRDWLGAVFPGQGEANLDGDPVLARLESEMPLWALAEVEARWRAGDRRLSMGARLARLYASPGRQRERLAIGAQLLTVPARTSLTRGWQIHLVEIAYPDPWPAETYAAAVAGGVPEPILLGLVRQESAFNHLAVSSAGAMGLTQLMPATAQEVARRRSDLYTADAVHLPAIALRWGADYLAGQMEAHGGDLPAALVAYNAGPHRSGPWQSAHPAAAYQGPDDPLRLLSIDLTETRIYVRAVLRNSWIYEYLETPSAGIQH